ncbi:hypothetical protein FB192DRAFT_1372924, partial [Mucor lusitanicus]
MNEAFEHSSADSSLLANKKDDTAAHDDPTYSETKSMVNVIDLTLNDKSSLNSNPEPTDDNQAHILSSSSSSSGSSDDDFRASRPAGLDSDNVSLNPRKRKYASLHQQSKGKERAEETDMQGILSNDAFVRLGNIVRHAEESKRRLQERIKTVNASFDIQAPFPDDISTYGTETFNIKTHFEVKSRLSQSQENLAAYKIGKLIERDRNYFSKSIVNENMKRYHQALSKKLKFYSHSEKQDLLHLSIYCKRVVHLVGKMGLYTLFIPEVLPPYRIKLTTPDNFEKIENYLNQRCTYFKNIAYYDQDGTLKMEDNKNNHAKDVGHSGSSSGSSSTSQFPS